MKRRSIALIAFVLAAGSVHAHDAQSRQPSTRAYLDDLVYRGPAIPESVRLGFVRIPELNGPIDSPWYLGRQPRRTPERGFDEPVYHCMSLDCEANRPVDPPYSERQPKHERGGDQDDGGVVYCEAIGCRPGEPGYGEPGFGAEPITLE